MIFRQFVKTKKLASLTRVGRILILTLIFDDSDSRYRRCVGLQACTAKVYDFFFQVFCIFSYAVPAA